MTALLLAVGLLAIAADDDTRGGAPSLSVQEMDLTGADDASAYLAATNRRGPMLAACYGSREALSSAVPVEAFLEVGKDGKVKLVSLAATAEGNSPELDACLLSHLNKARYPETARSVTLKLRLAPYSPPTDDDDA